MAMYDSAWKMYCLYVLSTVETNCNYVCVERSGARGIGLLQWTDSRSYGLLRLFYSDNPTLFTVEPMKSEISSGNSWGYRKFNIPETNNIIKILESGNSKTIQNDLWDKDITNDINSVLKPLVFTDSKTAIFAETLHWLGGVNPMKRVINNCGGARGTNIAQIRQAALNDPTFGSYVIRHNTVYDLLNKWDGESHPPDFGVNASGGEISDDYEPPQIPNIDKIIPNPETNVPDVSTPKRVSLVIEKMQKRGNIYHIIGKDGNNSLKVIQMYKEGVNIYLPNNKKTSENINPPFPTTPTPDNPYPKPDPQPIPPNPDKAQAYVDLARSYIGQIKYSMDGSLDSDRFSFTDGYADCSSFVITLYYLLMEKKLYGTGGLCTYTGNIKLAGQLIASGNNSMGIPTHKSVLKTADIIVFESSPGVAGGKAHVVIYSGNNSIVHCTPPQTREDNFDSYFSTPKHSYYYICRIF